MSVDQDGDGILHNALDHYDESSFNKLLEILENVKLKLGEEFFLKLIQLKSKKGQVFFFMRRNYEKCDLIPVFDWLKKIISDEKILREMICSVDNQGESLLHKYSEYCDKSTLSKIIKKILNWIRIEFGANTAENLILQRNRNGKYFVDLLWFKKDRKEIFAVLNEILRMLLDDFCISREFLKEVVFKHDVHSLTLLDHYTICYEKKSELCVALKEFLTLVREYLGKETLIEILFVKNKFEKTFLHLVVFNDAENEAITSLPEILNHLQEIFENDQQLMKNFLFQKDEDQWTLLHFYARVTDTSKVIELIKTFLNWIKNNLGAEAMEEMIFSKSDENQTFLPYLFENFKTEENCVKATMVLLKTEFSFDQQALKKLMGFEEDSQPSLLHCFALVDDNGKLLVETLKWLQGEFGMEDLVDMVLKKVFGYTFIHGIGFSKNKNAHLILVDVLNHLKTVFKDNPKQFENLILSTDYFHKTILHSFCDKQEISNLGKVLEQFIEWCDENLPKSQLEDYLFARDYKNKTFLHTLLEKPDNIDEEDENSGSDNNDSDDDNNSKVKMDKHKICYQIFCKTVIQLHETIDNKDKLKSLLEQKFKESSNLIEFVTENCQDIGFFIDWLKQHPEYPAPSEFKQADVLELSDSSTSQKTKCICL
jgi:hypothetical protein